MNRSRRTVRGRASRGRARRFVTRRQLTARDGGYAPRGTFDPPRVVSTPWFPVVLAGVLSYTDAGVKSISVSSIVALLKQQLGISAATFPVLLRFLRVSMWSTLTALAGTGGTYIAMRPSELIGLNPGTWLEDEGTVARPAHVHWMWPRADATKVFNSTSDADVVVVYTDVAGQYQVFIHLHVLWRPNGGDPIPSRSLFLQCDSVAPRPLQRFDGRPVDELHPSSPPGSEISMLEDM